jgi:hypothetical protein
MELQRAVTWTLCFGGAPKKALYLWRLRWGVRVVEVGMDQELFRANMTVVYLSASPEVNSTPRS